MRNATFLIAFALVLTLAAGCQQKGGATPRAKTDQPRFAVDPFEGEPRITAETHYAAGQLTESRIGNGPNMAQPGSRQASALQESALRQYEKALQLDPDHALALYSSASLWTGRKEFDKALPLWERYVEVTGRAPRALLNHAIAFELAGRPNDARPLYEEAISIDPTFKEARVNLGMLLARQGDAAPAASHLSAVLPPAAVHWHLGLAAQSRDDRRTAERHFRAAASLDPAYASRPRSGDTSASIVD